jgi:hypothetical protein
MTPYILILSWNIFVIAGGDSFIERKQNTQIITQRFENKQACMFAGNEALKIKAPNMKAVCVPVKLPEDK